MSEFITYHEIDTATDAVRERLTTIPQIALILGSGLGELADSIENRPDEDVHDLLNRPVVVGEEKISGGEKRKISIIRGLLKDPDLLILDESEADLDGYSRANLLDYLLTTKSDRITIIISHEKTIQSLADKILLLKEKK